MVRQQHYTEVQILTSVHTGVLHIGGWELGEDFKKLTKKDTTFLCGQTTH